MVGGLLAAAMALIFTVDQLVDMMSIGTLIAYTIVAISVLVLHYQCDAEAEALKIRATHGQVWQQLLNLNGLARPNRLSTTITKFGVALFIVCTVMLCIAVDYLEQNNFDNVVLGTLYVAVTVMLVIMLIILRQPKSEDRPTFQVPFVPFIPCLSIVMNLYLMFQLNMYTWIRLGVWAIFGTSLAKITYLILNYDLINLLYRIFHLLHARHSTLQRGCLAVPGEVGGQVDQGSSISVHWTDQPGIRNQRGENYSSAKRSSISVHWTDQPGIRKTWGENYSSAKRSSIRVRWTDQPGIRKTWEENYSSAKLSEN